MLNNTKNKFKPLLCRQAIALTEKEKVFYKEIDLLLRRKTIFILSHRALWVLRTSFVTRSVLFRKQSKLFIDLISGGSKNTFANRKAKLVSVWL